MPRSPPVAEIGCLRKEIEAHKSAADLAIKRVGIMFTHYSRQDGGVINRVRFLDIHCERIKPDLRAGR